MRRRIGLVLVATGLIGVGIGVFLWHARNVQGARGTAQELTLEELLAQGPGDNTYVTVRDYDFSGDSVLVTAVGSSGSPNYIETVIRVPWEVRAGPEVKPKARRYEDVVVTYLEGDSERVRSAKRLIGMVTERPQRGGKAKTLLLSEGFRPTGDLVILSWCGLGALGVILGGCLRWLGDSPRPNRLMAFPT